MEGASSYRRLLRKALAAALLCAALVVLCYRFVDRPVAFYVHDRGLAGYPFLEWLTYPPPVLQAWTPVALVALVVRRASGPLRRWERAAVAACVGMIVADQFRETLSYAFGRYWPETWVDGNPSLIRDGAYGFHPFRGDGQRPRVRRRGRRPDRDELPFRGRRGRGRVRRRHRGGVRGSVQRASQARRTVRCSRPGPPSRSRVTTAAWGGPGC